MQGLSSGVIQQLMQGLSVPPPYYFQLLNMKAVASKQAQPNAPKRYRLQINDGMHQMTMMLATQLQEMGDNGLMQDGTLLRVDELIPNEVQGRKVLIVLRAEAIGHHEGIIGNPVTYTDAANSGAPQPQPNNAGNTSAPGYGQPPGNGSMYGQPPGPTYGGPGPGGFNGAPGHGPGPQNGQNGGPGYGGPPQGQSSYQSAPATAPYGSTQAPAPYGRPVQPPQYGGSGAVARNEAPARIMPIKSLNPFAGRWTIKGRCTSRGEVRRWNNLRGEGKLFSFDLLDAGGGEIRVTAFNAEADKFYPMIEMGGIYMVSKAGLQPKKPQFNHTNHDFEIKLERDSVIERCPDDADTQAIPDIIYNFRSISDLGSVESGAMVDLLGVVESVDNWQSIMKKNGEETRKRSVTLRDRSGGSIELTLWGQYTQDPGDQLQGLVQSGDKPVIAVKSARVGDFNGKTVSTVGSSVLRVSPQIREAQDLLTWYRSGGSNERVTALSSGGGGGGGKRCTFSCIKEESLGHGEKPDWITVAGTVSYIKQQDGNNNSSVMYPSCPGDRDGRKCGKKVSDMGGSWHCGTCNWGGPEPEWKYLISLQASDHTAMTWLSVIGDAGDALFDGMKVAELKALQDNNLAEFEKRIWDANLERMVFRLKVCDETYQDERRIKVNIFKMDRMDYAKETKTTLDYIHKLEAGQPILTAKGPDAGPAAAGTNTFMQPNTQQQRWQGNGGGGGGSSQWGGPSYGGPPQSAGPGGFSSPPPRNAPTMPYGSQAPGVGGGYGAPGAAGGMGPGMASGGPPAAQGGGYGAPANGGSYGGPPAGGGYGEGPGYVSGGPSYGGGSGAPPGGGGGAYGQAPGYGPSGQQNGGPGPYGGPPQGGGPAQSGLPGGGYGGPMGGPGGPLGGPGGPAVGPGGPGGPGGMGGGYGGPPPQQHGPPGGGYGGNYGGPPQQQQQQQQGQPFW